MYCYSYCTVMKMDANMSSSKYEVVIVCLGFEENQSLQFLVYGICLIVSCIFLTATFVVYLLLPELRDLQGKCMMYFIFSLTLGYLSLAFMQLPFTASLLTPIYCVLIGKCHQTYIYYKYNIMFQKI